MYDEDDDDVGIMCATYTHARRHPMVLGHIGGWTPPFQLSLPQLAVVVATILFEVQTYRWWLAYLPRLVAVMVAVALPCLLAWAVRSARAEGRGLPRTAFAYLAMAWMPREGHVNGRPYKEAKASRPGRVRVYVAADEERW